MVGRLVPVQCDAPHENEWCIEEDGVKNFGLGKFGSEREATEHINKISGRKKASASMRCCGRVLYANQVIVVIDSGYGSVQEYELAELKTTGNLNVMDKLSITNGVIELEKKIEHKKQR